MRTDKDLLIEAAEEIAFLHRIYMERTPLCQPINRVMRLLYRIEECTGIKTDSPYPPLQTEGKEMENLVEALPKEQRKSP